MLILSHLMTHIGGRSEPVFGLFEVLQRAFLKIGSLVDRNYTLCDTSLLETVHWALNIGAITWPRNVFS